MPKFSFVEWFAAKLRNIGRANCDGTAHSVVMKVYDNGKIVCDCEIDSYETNEGCADRLYIAGRMNAFTSDLYGSMRKSAKEAAREAKRRAR